MDPTSVLNALTIPTSGRVFDLGSGWWKGMPGHSAHPSFEVITYRTPSGLRNQKDLAFLDESVNVDNYAFISELVMGTMHTGTHMDAISHVTCGPNDEWYGGGSAKEFLGDYGALEADATELPPFISRGVLLDIAKLMGVEALPAGFPIGASELQAACEGQGVDVTPGSIVLIRTGTMRHWPNDELMAAPGTSGLAFDGAEWLVERGIRGAGADTSSLEVSPSGVSGKPMPVHVLLIKEQGLPILEWVMLEELSQSGISEFLFLALPLTISGATASMIRPLAVA
jgi:kynurenine formamidase